MYASRVNPFDRIVYAYERDGGRRLVQKAVDRVTVETLRYLPPLYWSVAPQYYRMSRSFDTDSYETSVDPYALVPIDPDNVTRFSGREYPPWRNRKHRFGSVQGGQWDQRRAHVGPKYDYHADLYLSERFDESIIHRSIERHFDDGVPWRETVFVQGLVDWLNRHERVWHGCETDREILDRCRQIDELYESIRRRGYVRQHEFARREQPTTGFLETLANEIVVDIARDGEFLFVSGRHRLSIAKILGLNEIPVAVLVRHRKWMEDRDSRSGTEESDHPDLANPQLATGSATTQLE